MFLFLINWDQRRFDYNKWTEFEGNAVFTEDVRSTERVFVWTDFVSKALKACQFGNVNGQCENDDPILERLFDMIVEMAC